MALDYFVPNFTLLRECLAYNHVRNSSGAFGGPNCSWQFVD
ncbi:hypothetical protein QWZ13_17725 [Reinekea marina]|nr:hypothetical protein [Reinekea marina]MDN3650750.1 hypothetical protein [Reinekea marina]